MWKRPSGLALLLTGILAFTALYQSRPMTAQETTEETSRLAVLWTSGDPEVATRVAFMYTLNAKRLGWFDQVTLIVWGPSARLLAESEELQEAVRTMAQEGIDLLACKACADSYGVADELSGLGVEVKYMGEPLTGMLKGSWEVITF